MKKEQQNKITFCNSNIQKVNEKLKKGKLIVIIKSDYLSYIGKTDKMNVFGVIDRDDAQVTLFSQIKKYELKADRSRDGDIQGGHILSFDIDGHWAMYIITPHQRWHPYDAQTFGAKILKGSETAGQFHIYEEAEAAE